MGKGGLGRKGISVLPTEYPIPAPINAGTASLPTLIILAIIAISIMFQRK